MSTLPNRRLRRTLAGALLSAVAFGGAAGGALADHTGPIGSNFGFATDVAGTAFPGNNAFWAGTCDLMDTVVDDGGYGTPPDPNVERAPHCIDHGEADPTAAVTPTWLDTPSWRLDPLSQAGAHPDATVSFWMRKYAHGIPQTAGGAVTDGDARDIVVKLPPGFVGDPTAVPFCRSEDIGPVPTTCPPETQIGVSTVTLTAGTEPRTATFPVYNVEPRDGKTAEFIVSGAGSQTPITNIPIVARVRTDGDFGVDTMALQIPAGFPLLAQSITIWGVPWAAHHDVYRPEPPYGGSEEDGGIPETGLTGGTATIGVTEVSQEPQSYEPGWGEIKPFVWNPTRCGASPSDRLVTWIETLPWQIPTNFVTEDAPADAAVDGCEDVPFEPSLGLAPTSSLADAPSGLDVDLTLPPNPGLPFDPPTGGASQPEVDQYVADAADYWRTDPGRLAPSSLKDTTVTLPPGMAVNPSGAAGLEGCTDAQVGLTQAGSPPLFNNSDPFDGDAADGVECPAGSKLGTVRVVTPVLEDVLTGEIALGQPKSTDPTSGQMFRLFLVVRNRLRGVVAKVFGSAVADPATGQLTATFANNPELPLESVEVRLKGGERGTLRTPQRCGTPAWTGTFAPWSGVNGEQSPVSLAGTFGIGARCAFPFSPATDAGMDNRAGGGSGTFTWVLTRQDGEQWIRSITAKMPTGLIASLRGVPLCSNAQAAAGACPAGSRLGTVDAAAGAGLPYFLERKGDVYLTEGYKGAPYGLMTRVPVEAGPFRGALALTPIVVRQALRVDPRSAQVTVESDPLPQIWHGIPLAMRQATLRIDRPNFMRNPTDCSPKRIETTIESAEGARSLAVESFQATRCGSLRFRPAMKLALTGRRQMRTGKHPGIKAVVRVSPGQAGIKRAQVRLPRTLALDPANARALCEFEDGTRPDLENHCPAASKVGRARVATPLLNRPLAGDVYFVKNIRIDPRSGAQRRTLPMIVLALRGEIDINLYGQSDAIGGKLVSTFESIPDAPVSRFDLTIKGGRRGIVAVTRNARRNFNLCKMRRGVAQSDLDGHNGARHDTNERFAMPCKKTKKKKKRKRR